jgi:hypothetical protein
VIQRGGKPGTAVQDGETYDAIADMSLVRIVKTAGDSLHAEYLLVKGCHAILILGVESEMSDFSRHNFPLL